MGKIDECYKISEQIIDCYIDFLCSPVYAVSEVLHDEMVKNIMKLVQSEYDVIHSLSLEEVDNLLNDIAINNNVEYDEMIISRIRNKLTDYKQILLGNCIDLYELDIFELDDTDFSIYDSILSMINIEIIKNIKNKIYSLTSTCVDEERFINSLKKKLKLSKIELLFSTNVSEILSLNFNTSIDEMPLINIDNIRDKINELGSEDIKYAIENTLILSTRRCIDKLLDDEFIDLNPSGVFKHLITITQLEILINYMDNNILHSIYNHFVMIDSDKKPGIDKVKRLIKNKFES